MQGKDLNYSFSEVFNSHKGHYADKWEGYLFIYDEIFSQDKEYDGRIVNPFIG